MESSQKKRIAAIGGGALLGTALLWLGYHLISSPTPPGPYPTGKQQPIIQKVSPRVFQVPRSPRAPPRLNRFGDDRSGTLESLDAVFHLEEAKKIHYAVFSPSGKIPSKTGKTKKHATPTIEDTTVAAPGRLFFQRRTSYILPRPVMEQHSGPRDAIILMDVSGSMTYLLLQLENSPKLRKERKKIMSSCVNGLKSLYARGVMPKEVYSKLVNHYTLQGRLDCRPYFKYLRNNSRDYRSRELANNELEAFKQLITRIDPSAMSKPSLNIAGVAAISIAQYYIKAKNGYVSGGRFNQDTRFTDYTKNLDSLVKIFAVRPEGGTMLDATQLHTIITHHSRPDKSKPLDIYIISDLEIENIDEIIGKVRGLTQKGRVYVLTPTEEGKVTVMFGKEAYRAPLRNMDDLRKFYRNFKKEK